MLLGLLGVLGVGAAAGLWETGKPSGPAGGGSAPTGSSSTGSSPTGSSPTGSSSTGSSPAGSSPAGSSAGQPLAGYLDGEQVGPDGALLGSFFGTDLALEQHGAFGWDRVSVLRGAGPAGRDAVRVKYPADSASQRSENDDGTSDGGAQAYLSLPAGELDEAWLGYDVRFPTGFTFVKGGKLPGLFGGTVTSGQHIPDGTNGFSTRYMWRAEGAGEVYAYLPTSVVHGTSLGRGSWFWPTGRWVRAVQHVKLNTPGRADGLVEVWLDGLPVLTQRGLTYRTVPELRIQGLFFSTFFGGGDASWASPVDQFADFAGFTVSATAVPRVE